MPVDLNGYNIGSTSLGLFFGTSSTQIAPADYGIRHPTLPAMLGSCTDGSGTYKCYPFPVNDVNLNIGSCWSTSTFRFTAPVAGIYYTSYAGIVGIGTTAASYGYYSIIINGASLTFSYEDVNNNWTLLHTELMVKLEAGDWLSWAMNIAPGSASALASGAYRGNHNHCTIWLVG